MTVRELREKYLRFFESKGHTIHDSGSLIPIDVTGRLDESLLFNGAGMIQFKPYFLGTATPPNKRLVRETSTKLATTATLLSSRCWAILALETISKRKRLLTRGSF
jgi:hypothetical protein